MEKMQEQKGIGTKEPVKISKMIQESAKEVCSKRGYHKYILVRVCSDCKHIIPVSDMEVKRLAKKIYGDKKR